MTSKLQTYLKHKPSGIDWLGDIPVGWGTKRNLGLFSERNERVKYFTEEDFELLSVTIQKGVVRQLELAENEQRKDSSNEDKGNYKWVRRGDIAYNKMRMWQGAAGESKHEGIVSPAYIILRSKTGVLPRYFHYFFRTEMFNEIAYQYGYGIADDQHSLRYWQFKTLYSPFPPLEIQRQIADFLDEKAKIIDELMAKKEEMIEFLREKRAALITRAVTKGLDPNAKLKPSGIDWLGDIPEGWKTRRLKLLLKLINEKGSGDSENRVALENIESGTGKYIETSSNYEGGTKFYKKDVLFGKLRPYLAKVYLTQDDGEAIGDILVYRTNKDILPKFAFYFFLSDGFIGVVNSSTFGAKMPRAESFFIGNLIFIYPDIEQQKQITDFLDAETAKIDKAVAFIELQIEKLKECRSSLIYHAVTGKIKV